MSEINIGSLLEFTIQPLEESPIVEMNIDQGFSLMKLQCCGAAKPKTHDADKDLLGFWPGCLFYYHKIDQTYRSVSRIGSKIIENGVSDTIFDSDCGVAANLPIPKQESACQKLERFMRDSHMMVHCHGAAR